jgi:predicted dehydrogenase
MTTLRHGRKLRCAMVGGGRDAFIGGVHRAAMALDGQIELVAGALSSSPDKALASGHDLGLSDTRNHGRWQDLLDHELRLPPEDRVDFVTIVTPNDVHFEVALACIEAGLHVVCDKPLVHSSQQAEQLMDALRQRGTVFAVTYNYSGYPMVRQAREMVRSGAVGSVRKVIVEYHQGWLATHLESSGNKQAAWRADPAKSGLAGAIGDIGSHAEQLLSTVTGLQVESLCADWRASFPGVSSTTTPACCCGCMAARAACCWRLRLPPATRTTSACGCSAARAAWTGGRKNPTCWCSRRSMRRARS